MSPQQLQIQLLAYEPEWQILFLEERDRLQASIGEYVLDIQHIGSTSIPGIAAKPILDIGIAIINSEEGVRCIQPMEKLGYKYKVKTAFHADIILSKALLEHITYTWSSLKAKTGEAISSSATS